MSLLAAKLGGLAVLLLSSLLLGLLPFLLRPWLRAGGERRRTRLALSCLQCLGGGVLLATVFTHMLPEVRESLAAAGGGGSFPLAEVLICAGLFSIYAVEEVALLMTPRAGADADEVSALMDGSAAEKASSSSYGAVPTTTTSPGHGHTHAPPLAAAPATGLAAFRVLIVTAALSVHSVFEGVAIGLESSETSAWLLTAAITAHKSIIAFCLGEQLAVTQRRLRAAVVSLLVFVTASPLGIVVGLLVTSAGGNDVDSQTFATDVLQALAAGTILYVVLFEIIQGERAKPGGGLLKLLAILVGFGIMLTVHSLIQEPDGGAAPDAAGNSTVPPP